MSNQHSCFSTSDFPFTYLIHLTLHGLPLMHLNPSVLVLLSSLQQQLPISTLQFLHLRFLSMLLLFAIFPFVRLIVFPILSSHLLISFAYYLFLLSTVFSMLLFLLLTASSMLLFLSLMQFALLSSLLLIASSMLQFLPLTFALLHLFLWSILL